MMNKQSKILIVGAGLAGLSAAYWLAERGFKNIEIFEKSGRVGGLTKSYEVNGNIYDTGPHRFHAKNIRYLDFFKEIMKEDYFIRLKKTEIYFQGKYLKYPISKRDILFNLNFFESISVAKEFLISRTKYYFKKPIEHNLKDWIINRFGNKLFEIYFKPYTKKLWGIPAEDISVDWAYDRIPLNNFWELVLKTLLSGIKKEVKDKNYHSPYLSYFYYPKNGIGDFSKKIAENLISKGVKIHLNTEIMNLSSNKSYIISAQLKKGETICGDYFIETSPITNVITKLSKKKHDEGFSKLKFLVLILGFIQINKQKVTKNHWIYYPQKEIIFNRLTEMKNFSPFTCKTGKTGLVLEVTCLENTPIFKLTEEQLKQQLIKGLILTGLVKRKDIGSIKIKKIKAGYPIYFKDYKLQLNRAYRLFQSIKNFSLIGRQSTYKYFNMEQVLLQSLNEVNNITNKVEQ